MKRFRACLNVPTEGIFGYGRMIFARTERGTGGPVASEVSVKSAVSETKRPRVGKSRQALILISLLFVAAGCNPAAKFSLVEAEAPVMRGLSSVHGRATVANGGSRDFMVESAVFVVRYRDRELGAARLLLPVEIPAGDTSRVRYDLALEGLSLSSLQTLQTRIMTNPGAFTVEGSGWVRWGCFRKKIEMKDVTLTQIMGIIANFAP